MFRRFITTFLLATAITAIPSGRSVASDVLNISVGLSRDAGVFLQEYWEDDRPFYAVLNETREPAHLVVCEWEPRSGPGDVIAEWHVPPRTFIRTVAPYSTKYGRWNFRQALSNGSALGIFYAPASGFDLEGDRIVARSTLHLPGGRGGGIEMFHEVFPIVSGGVAAVDVRVEGLAGDLWFPKGPLASDPRIVSVLSVTSASLLVREGADAFVTNLGVTFTRSSRSLRVTYRAPIVESPTMAVIEVRNSACGRGSRSTSIRRYGVAVLPKETDRGNESD